MSRKNEDQLIVIGQDLEKVCLHAKDAGVLALDTEFVWRNTYLPRLGIIQFGIDHENCFALDCIPALATASLKAAIEDASIVKILHDARQDLNLVHVYCGAVPQTIFDTQVAAVFAGLPPHYGLQKLLADVLDVHLPKTETCTDWLHRPLDPAQWIYALDDVRYLPALREELLTRAESRGMRAWLEEEMVLHCTKIAEDIGLPETNWKRIRPRRGVTFDRRNYAVLRELCTVREKWAKEWNFPRSWLGEDGFLVNCAVNGVVDHFHSRCPAAYVGRMKRFYEDAITAALALPEEEWPADPHPYYIEEVKLAYSNALKWLEEKAAALQMDPSFIVNHATLMAFIDDAGDPENPLNHGWRYEAFGAEIAEKFAVD